MADSRVILKLDPFPLRDIVFLADGDKQLSLLYGINPEVGLHIKVKFKHVLGISGFIGNEINHLFHHLRIRFAGHSGGRNCGCSRCHRCGRCHRGSYGRSSCLRWCAERGR